MFSVGEKNLSFGQALLNYSGLLQGLITDISEKWNKHPRPKAMAWTQTARLPPGQAQFCWHLGRGDKIIRLALAALAWVDRVDSFCVCLGPGAEMTQLRGVPQLSSPFPGLCEENKQIPPANHVSAADSLLRAWRILQLCCCASGLCVGDSLCIRLSPALSRAWWIYSLSCFGFTHWELLQQLKLLFLSSHKKLIYLSVQGNVLLQSCKLHIWVTHCMEWGSCGQLSQELDSHQMLGLGEKGKEPSNSREGVFFGIRIIIC